MANNLLKLALWLDNNKTMLAIGNFLFNTGRRISDTWMIIPKWIRFILRFLAIVVTALIWIPLGIAVIIIVSIIAVITEVITPIVTAYKNYK